MEEEEDIKEPIQHVYNENDINLIDDLCSESSSQTKVYTKDIYIYSWGKNKFGELGINTARTAFIPSPIKAFNPSQVKSIASGGRNTMILTSESQLYVCGSNIFNLLATSSKTQNNEGYQKVFKPIKFFEENNEKIEEISIAEFHSLALNEKGEIYGWGGNLFNKLGQTNGLCGLPSKIYIKRKIISVACGDYHSCALSENGVLYTWGGGGESYNKGQCGQGSKKDIETPKKVEFFTKKGLHILMIACGGYHTIVMDEKNELYGFGKGIFGQCGYGQAEDTDIPRKIIFNDKNLNKIINIKCGGEHTLFLSEIGRVYACGHGYFGQLGLGNNKNVKSPILVHSLTNKNIIEIASGWSHSLALTDDGYVYSTGCGKFGELGLGDNKNKYNYNWIRKLGYMNIKHIFAGGHHSWCIIDDKFPLKEKFLEPEPLAKSNYKMVKRKHSVSDKNNMSFNEQLNMRNKSSDGYRNIYANNLANSYDDIQNRKKENNNTNANINIISNNKFKKHIDDYNDNKLNTDNNIDNLIDYIDSLNNKSSENRNIYDLLNNNNKQSKFDTDSNKIDNYLSKSNENDNNNKFYNSLENHNSNNNKEYNSLEDDNRNNKNNIKNNEDIMDNLSDNENINNNISNNNINNENIDNINKEYINEDDYIRNNFNSNKNNENIQTSINDINNNINNDNNIRKNIYDDEQKKYSNIQQKNIINISNFKLLKQNKIQLQVIYTSLNLSHRFIRFEISNTNKYYQIDNNSIYNLVKKYLSSDKGNIYFKLQNDNEIFKSGNIAPNQIMESIMKDMRNNGMFNLTKKNKISYTIVITYDYRQNEIMKKLYESMEDKYIPNDKNGLMNMKLIDEDQIVNEGENLEGVLSKWTTDFYEQFKELFLINYDNDYDDNILENKDNNINRPRFFEMRPKIFQ